VLDSPTVSVSNVFSLPVFLREGVARPEKKPEESTTVKEKRRGGTGKRLVCVDCGRLITRGEERAVVNGRHEHTSLNPHGIVYHIGCFESAPGCSPQGAVSTHWSWFPGYAWQVVLCAGCLLHLGWLFRGPEGGFYGLIINRLREEDETKSD
jgi:hypothetical protein